MMDLSFLTTVISPTILGICLIVGYLIKTSIPQIKNNYIPMIVALLGLLIAIVTNIPNVTPEVILAGLTSGLASTGLFETLRNMIDKNK